MVSTYDTDGICVSICIGKDIIKAVPVCDYNIHVGSVDLKDQILGGMEEMFEVICEIN